MGPAGPRGPAGECSCTDFTSEEDTNALFKIVEDQRNLIEELQMKFALVKESIESMESKESIGFGSTGSSFPTPERALLGQNMPNPFNSYTKIPYYVPQDSKSATLQIHNVLGQIVQSVPITSFGEGAVELLEIDLNTGQYSISLQVDGAIIQTKMMSVVK